MRSSAACRAEASICSPVQDAERKMRMVPVSDGRDHNDLR
jgi:hypothetical protein